MNIMNVNARYPGSSHDSFVWRSSMASALMVNEHERDPDTHLYLLGDSGYPLQPWLMVPVANANTPEELHYNRMHSKTRNKVERCIGVLKIGLDVSFMSKSCDILIWKPHGLSTVVQYFTTCWIRGILMTMTTKTHCQTMTMMASVIISTIQIVYIVYKVKLFEMNWSNVCTEI